MTTKRLVFFAFFALVFCSNLAHAQTEKGRWLAGGNASFSATYTRITPNQIFFYRQKQQEFGLQLSPSAGYFALRNLAVGGQIDFGYALGKTTFEYDPANSYTQKFKRLNAGGGVFAKYYLRKEGRPLAPFALASVSYLYRREKIMEANGYTTTFQTGGVQTLAGVGLAYFLKDYMALEALVGYRFSNQIHEFVSTNYENYRPIEHKVAIQLGVSWFL